MYDQMDEAEDRCWAHNKTGQRCEMIAGHDGLHNVIIAWDNSECWTPTMALVPPTIVHLGTQQVTGGPSLADAAAAMFEPPVGTCVMCEHPDHRGRCNEPDGDFDCDCAEGIPA